MIAHLDVLASDTGWYQTGVQILFIEYALPPRGPDVPVNPSVILCDIFFLPFFLSPFLPCSNGPLLAKRVMILKAWTGPKVNK